MPRYFLHIRDRDGFTEDAEGAEFEGLAQAVAAALVGARDILAEQIEEGRPLDGDRIEICDEGGALVETVRFADIVEIKPSFRRY